MVEPRAARPAAPPAQRNLLFYERGASWYWMLFGPAAGLTMLLVQHSSGYGLEPVVPSLLLVLVSGLLAVQVRAARTHTSVELTEETLREGTETIRIADIVMVYPEPKRSTDPREKPQNWQQARTLGELNGVPRGRTGIGLQLTGSRTAQAWARNHRGLRAVLTPLVRQCPEEPAGPFDPGIDDDGQTARSRW